MFTFLHIYIFYTDTRRNMANEAHPNMDEEFDPWYDTEKKRQALRIWREDKDMELLNAEQRQNVKVVLDRFIQGHYSANADGSGNEPPRVLVIKAPKESEGRDHDGYVYKLIYLDTERKPLIPHHELVRKMEHQYEYFYLWSREVAVYSPSVHDPDFGPGRAVQTFNQRRLRRLYCLKSNNKRQRNPYGTPDERMAEAVLSATKIFGKFRDTVSIMEPKPPGRGKLERIYRTWIPAKKLGSQWLSGVRGMPTTLDIAMENTKVPDYDTSESEDAHSIGPGQS